MHEAKVTIRLLDEIVVSERAASEGGHSSLDYLPGSLLLGAAASRLYKELKDDAHIVFHSGKVRFCNGLPLAPSGLRAHPMPLAWHIVKDGPSPETEGMLHGDQLHNRAHGWGFTGLQPKQVRGGYVTPQGEFVRVGKRFRMKTAIDANEGRAAEGQLFGYESLAAGSLFQARITADEDVSAELFKRVCDALTGTHLLGRSRSAQYGEVMCDVEFVPHAAVSQLDTSAELTLWLASDLCCLDDLGMPTLHPEPHWLGLPTGKLLIEKSFIRTRVVSPYNGFRGSHDMERQVICQGSVLAFRFDQSLASASGLGEKLAAGLGMWRESGLGEVIANSPLLATASPAFTKAPHAIKPKCENAPPKPASPLVDWLQERMGLGDDEESVLTWLAQCRQELDTLHVTACKLGGADVAVCMGPSRAQWGRVLEMAQRSGLGSEGLRVALFSGADAVIPDNDDAWQVRGMLGTVEQTFRAWLEAKVIQTTPLRIALLAKDVQARMQGNIRRPQ